jgi:cardiolipin synthase
MYDPLADEQTNEWIEIYNPTEASIDLAGWMVEDSSGTDKIEGDSDYGDGTTILPPQYYAIITDEGTTAYQTYNVNDDTVYLKVDDGSIGNGLGNTKDKLLLKNATGIMIDSVEWGQDYTDVPGKPAEDIPEGYSLARSSHIDNDDSSKDFIASKIPTPGSPNEFVPVPSLQLYPCPRYCAKIYSENDYSLPFTVKVRISYYSPDTEYLMRLSITGENTTTSVASQTWNGSSWKYSNNYRTIITDDQGNWSEWMMLRFNRGYKGYQQGIANYSSALLSLKLKDQNGSTKEITKQLLLLDMDTSTSNGIQGGYNRGIADHAFYNLNDRILILCDTMGNTLASSVSEKNNISEGLPHIDGYYKIAGPAGHGYHLLFCTRQGKLLYRLNDISLYPGDYNVALSVPTTLYQVRDSEYVHIPLTINNTGDFADTYTLSIENASHGWLVSLQKETITLQPGHSRIVTVSVEPCRSQRCSQRTFIIRLKSQGDPSVSDELTFQIDLKAPDMSLLNMNLLDTKGDVFEICSEGDVVKIKTTLKNNGNVNATNVSVRFYYDDINSAHLIGSKHYATVSTTSRKYPSISWDTTGISPGNHTILIVVDHPAFDDEPITEDNTLSTSLYVQEVPIDVAGKALLLTEVYYYTHSGIHNEYLRIINPTSDPVDISGYYLTTDPFTRKDKQAKLVFPNQTILPSKDGIYVVQNATAFIWETAKTPDFEYEVDSMLSIPQLITVKTFRLPNTGGKVAIKDSHNRTIDLVIYGDETEEGIGWSGSAIPSTGCGVVLMRNCENESLFVDSNTSNDWISYLRHGIGQSLFSFQPLLIHGQIRTFVSPDCSYTAVVRELQEAKESIYLNMYEFTSAFLCEELISALRRNVTVTLFLEGSPIGGIDEREKYLLHRLASNGAQIRFIVSDSKNKVYVRYAFNHAKYLVIDENIVIVESCNWVDTGIPKDPTYGNREWGVIIENSSIADQFLKVFQDDYNPSRCDSYAWEQMNYSAVHEIYMDDNPRGGRYVPMVTSETFNGTFVVIPVFSPDNSIQALVDMISSAQVSIYLQQLYVYTDWKDQKSPLVDCLINKSQAGVDIRVILNLNPSFKDTVEQCNITKHYLESRGIKVRFVYTNWSIFCNVHNKGMIVDNCSVLISSINWNENSLTRNREAGVIIQNEDVASYYASVFFHDWILSPSSFHEVYDQTTEEDEGSNYDNTIYIMIIFSMTFALIARDWSKREWS